MLSIEQQELQNESLKLYCYSLSNNGKLEINKKINGKVRYLKQEFDLEYDEILNQQFQIYLEKKLYEKYNPQKALSTFVAHSANYGLSEEKRKFDNRKKKCQEISLDELLQGSSDDLSQVSLSYLKKIGVHGIVEYTTPEDLCIAKELMELILDHYGKDDTKVLLGYTDRRTEAERLSITYNAYSKRLFRKTRDFIPVLKEAGYC